MLILIYNRMFDLPPPLGGADGHPQVEITEDRHRIKEADAVVFHVPSLEWTFFRRKRPGQVWVSWFMECEQNYLRLQSKRFMARFDLKMSHHQDADIMVSYIPESLRTLRPEALAGNRHEHLMCSFISGDVDRSGRIPYLKALSNCIDIHRYGRHGNREIPGDEGEATKMKLSARYKFSFAFENAIAPDYVTEKFFQPLLAGSVPVYLGAPNVDEYAPVDDCYINAADFSGPQALADYLLELDRDRAAYEHYLNWRQRRFKPGFKALCRKCPPRPFEKLGGIMLERRASGR